MPDAISILTLDQWLIAVIGALIAGLVKGVVGFALPMVMISILGSVVSPELALAGLILPTLVTNGQQALRQGASAALSSIVKFRVFMLTALIVLLISAQLIRVIPNALFLGAIGVMVIGFSLLQALMILISIISYGRKAIGIIEMLNETSQKKQNIFQALLLG